MEVISTSTPEQEDGEESARLLVALRIRPLTPEEAVSGELKVAHALEDKMVVLIEPTEDKGSHTRSRRPLERQYVFDLAFDSETPQDSVYVRTTGPLVESVISGYNGTVFAYGATGTGKTYTMVGTDEEPGIMVRALNNLFQRVEQTSEDLNYQVTMSYLEIYNEMIRDLLNPASGHLELREDAKGMQVVGLTELSTTSTQEVIKLLARGNRARTVEPTSANRTSSRSHALLQVAVRQHSRIRNTVQEVRCGRLYMIDLAGSERAAQTQNRGKRLVEGAHINRSLLALGNCINALAEGGSKFVNYRDSKLTRLLKDALSGNCRTVMIAHISPIGAHFEESRNTLVYADRAKSIRNKIKPNIMDVSYHVAQYQTIIDELRQEIYRLRTKIISEPPVKVPKGGISKAENAAILKNLKDQLVETFNEQMEIRNHLMQIDNHVLELSIEFERQSMIVSQWDSERLRKAASAEGKSKDNKDLENASEKEGSLDWEVEPTEVRYAWDEMLFLQDEQRRYWDMRQDVERQFKDCRIRAAKLEEELPQRINSDEQRELLVLLCKVHELEIEKMEMQAENFLKEHELRRKDMVIMRYGRQRNLCDEIINKQRDIIKLVSEGQSDQQTLCPPELQDLYDQYRTEVEDMIITNDQQAKSSATSTRPDIFTKPGIYRHLQSGLPKLQEEKDKKQSKPNRSVVQQTSNLDRLRLGSSNARAASKTGTAGVSLPPIDLKGPLERNGTVSEMKDSLQNINARAAARRRSLRTADLKGLPAKPSSLSIIGSQETRKESSSKMKPKNSSFGYRSSTNASDEVQIWKPKPMAPSSIRAKGKSANAMSNYESNVATVIPVAIAPAIPTRKPQRLPANITEDLLRDIDQSKIALQKQQDSFERKFKEIISAPTSPIKTTSSATYIPKRAST